jgi:hypothetical protein
VHDDISTELQGILDSDRQEPVVDHDSRPRGVRQVRHCLDVHECLHGIGGGLEEDGRSGRGQRIGPLLEIFTVDKGRLHAPFGQNLVAHDEARAEQAACCHQPITRFQTGH